MENNFLIQIMARPFVTTSGVGCTKILPLPACISGIFVMAAHVHLSGEWINLGVHSESNDGLSCCVYFQSQGDSF